MMSKRAGILALLIIAVAVFWMRPEKRVGRNADAGGFILRAHAQTANYGGVSIGGTYATNCIPLAPTAATLNCSSITDNGTTVSSAEFVSLSHAGDNTNAILRLNSTAAFGLMFGSANNNLGLKVDATNWLMVANNTGNQLQLPSTGVFGWSSTTTYAANNSDTFLRRRSAANIAMGAVDVNGVPVAQSFSTQNAITGTDLPGTVFSFIGSLGTGVGLPAPVVIQGADASVATGATAQTAINRFVSADTKNLTSGAATTLLSIPLATLQTTGGLVFIHMEATDGTNQCTLDDLVTYAAENSAGVFVVNTSKMGTGANACTATKTLTATYAVTSANPALLQVTPTLGGITATRFTAVYTVMHGGMTQPTL